MRIFKKLSDELARTLRKGGVGVMPTDTIYGIVGSALSKKAVARIYKLRKRRLDKPMIILIGSKFDVRSFDVHFDYRSSNILNKIWPGRVSVILPCRSKKLKYLHRGTNTLAFRLPAKKALREFLKKTGPLAAPSANLEGKPPARTIREARKYFESKVDFYVDAGKVIGTPSAIIAIRDGTISVLRK